MSDDRDRVAANLLVDWGRIGEEVQVRVQIGDEIHLRVPVQDEQRQRGRARKIVFDRRPVLFGPQEVFITFLILVERDWVDARGA